MSDGGRGGETDRPINELRDRLLAEGPTFEDVFCQLFRVRPAAGEAYLTLLAHPGSTTDELAAQLGLHPSSVHRSLAELLECDLAIRERNVQDGGGLAYYYTVKPIDETKTILSDLLQIWMQAAQEQIDHKDTKPGGDK